MGLSTAASRRPPVASDAEIRAYLLPRLKAGKRPTYAAMRADLGGGGFSRLVRIRNQVEAELGGAQAADGQTVAGELVAALEALFARQWKALEEWERLTSASLHDAIRAAACSRATKTKAVADSDAIRLDRFEGVERRLLAGIDKLKAVSMEDSARARDAAPPADRGDVPPSWARQAAAAATAALDGRLQSMEETMRDATDSGRAAFESAAQVAREVAAETSLQIHLMWGALGNVGDQEQSGPGQSAALDEILRHLGQLRNQVGNGFSTAAAVADRRAAAIRDAIIAMVDIEAAQCEMLHVVGQERAIPSTKGANSANTCGNQKRKQRTPRIRKAVFKKRRHKPLRV